MNLRDREYWTPTEAAAVMGRSAAYWARVYDEGLVRGYRDRGRHLQAESCRALLERLSERDTVAPAAVRLAEAQRIFWNHQRARVAG